MPPQVPSVSSSPPSLGTCNDPCCTDRTHCTNMGDSAHAGAILAANLKLRAVLKRKLGGSENGTLWILDTCSSVKNPSELPVPEKLAALKSISARDGVHLTDEGSKTLASNTGEVIHKLQNGLLGKVPLYYDRYFCCVHFRRGHEAVLARVHIPGWKQRPRPPGGMAESCQGAQFQKLWTLPPAEMLGGGEKILD